MEVVGVKPILFEENNTNYDHNGIGVLHDALSCEVYEEHNGVLDVTLEYPSDGSLAKYIREDMQILAKPNDVDAPHAFRIYEIEKDLESDVIIAYGTSITDDLRGNFLAHLKVEDKTPQQVFDEMKLKLIEPTMFDFVSDIQHRSSSEWNLVNPLLAIAGVDGSLIDIWGGDIKRTNNTIYLYSRRGRDRVTTIRPGKNIDGFNMVVSIKGIITKIVPYFTYSFQGLNEYQMTQDYDGEMVKTPKYTEDVEEVEPITIFGETVTSANADKYSVHYYNSVDYSDDDEMLVKINEFIQAKQKEVDDAPGIIDTTGFDVELKQFVTDLLNEEAKRYFIYRNPGCDEPSVKIKANLVQLSDSPEWERYKKLETIQVSDTIDVYVKKFDVDIEMNIASITYDSIGERVVSIVAGSKSTNLTQSIAKPYEEKQKQLENYIKNMENGVYNTINKTANGQSRKFNGYTEPPADISSKGDLWFREMGAGVVETYIYDGSAWVQVMSDAVIESMNKAIGTAVSKAEQAEASANKVVTDMSATIQGSGFTNLKDLIASKVSDGEFNTLFFQQSKAIGLVYEVGGVNEAIIMIDEGIPYIKGEHIILDGDTIVDGTFTVTETMLANDAIINKLKATGIDANQIRVINLDVDSIAGGDLELSRGFRITNNGFPVLEVDAITGQVKITAPNIASKDDLLELPSTSDLDSLGQIVSSISSELNTKTGMGEFEAMRAAFEARVKQDIIDKDQLSKDLATIEGRTTLVETIAGNNKLVTEFIETVITQSEEGIFVGNESNRTGILLSDKRISFLDKNTEVAYISNQTMEIKHGIFVESAIISDFKFEKIPGTTILAITWVGD